MFGNIVFSPARSSAASQTARVFRPDCSVPSATFALHTSSLPHRRYQANERGHPLPIPDSLSISPCSTSHRMFPAGFPSPDLPLPGAPVFCFREIVRPDKSTPILAIPTAGRNLANASNTVDQPELIRFFPHFFHFFYASELQRIGFQKDPGVGYR